MSNPFGAGVLGEPEDWEINFSSDPIVAWRTWRVAIDFRRPKDEKRHLLPKLGDQFTLMSTNYALRWPQRRPMISHCLPQLHNPYRSCNGLTHSRPGLKTSCGIYAFKERDSSERYFSGSTVVFGQVLLWGQVIRFTEGYRAERAYPHALWLFPRRMDMDYVERIADGMREAYGVETHTLLDWDARERP